MQQFPGLIVTAVDGSEESIGAAKFAMDLANLTGSEVVALSVLHLPEYVSDDVRNKMKMELATKADTALDAVGARAAERGIKLTKERLDTTASVVDAICGFAESKRAGLVVLGTRGTGGVAKLMLGSVAVGVAKAAKCPVLVVR